MLAVRSCSYLLDCYGGLEACAMQGDGAWLGCTGSGCLTEQRKQLVLEAAQQVHAECSSSYGGGDGWCPLSRNRFSVCGSG